MTARRTGALLLLTLAALSASAQESGLPPFRLEDQFGSAHSDAEFRGAILVLLAGDREGSKHTRAWKEALKAALSGVPGAEGVRFAGLADLRGVPGFLQGMVRSRFPKEPERWVMLDWEGLFGKDYGLERGVCTVLVFDAEGRLVHRAGGKEPDPKGVEAAAAAVRALLAQPAPPRAGDRAIR
jgi:hypothetical protein